MKRLITMAGALLALCLFAPLAQAQNSDEALYKRGLSAYEGGNYDAAYKIFSDLVKRHPNHAKIRYYQRNARVRALAGAPKAGLEAQLRAINIAEISLEDASLDLVFQYLSQKATELSGGKVTANFIYRGPKEEHEKGQISLKLSNVPLTEVIRYIGEMSGTHFKYEQHAIVAMPVADVPAPVAPNAKPQPADPFAPRQRGKADSLDPFA